MSQRKTRVEHGLRDVLTGLLDEVRDPRVRAVTLLTIAKVECNVDMAVANVYVSIVDKDEDKIDAAIAGLNKAAGFLRGPAGRELGLQHAPELRFKRDVSIDVSAHLASILREDEAKARAAGRKVGEAQPESKSELPEKSIHDSPEGES